MTTNNNNRKFKFCDNNNANILHNAGFQFAQRHALSLYKKNAIYSFIPKNGCTTLRASLAACNGFLDTSNDIEKSINWVHNNTYTFSSSLKELICANYTFTILRCPYSRLVSLFLDKFVDKTPVAWTFYRLSNNIFNLDKLTFANFIEHLYDHPSSVNGDIHWRKQSDFLVYQEYDDYFNFNNFEVISTTLNNKLGFSLVDTRLITNHGREQHELIETGNFSTAPTSDLLRMKDNGTMPSIESMLTTELKEKINKIYKIDFELQKRVL